MVFALQNGTAMRLSPIAMLAVLVGSSGCVATGHGCRRGRGDGAFALVDFALSLVELGATVANVATESAPPRYVATPAPPPRHPIYGRLVSQADGTALAGVALALYRQGVWVDRTTSRIDGTFSFPHLYDLGFYAIAAESRPDLPLSSFDLATPGSSFQPLWY
jgi:hypothetical protein